MDNLIIEDDDELEMMQEEVGKSREIDGATVKGRKAGKRRSTLRQSIKFDTYADLRRRLMTAFNGG